MAQVIVDLRGNSDSLEKAYDVSEKKDKRLRDALADTGKVGQDAASKIGREYEQTADKSTRAMNAVLRELRKQGPEGKVQAQAVEMHLRETGKAGRKSMESIVKSLGMLDDEAAKVARNATTDLKKVEVAGDDAFGDGAIDKLTAFAGGFASVGSAVAAVNAHLRDQAALMEEAREAQVNLATIQSDAAKNLIGLSELERSQLLRAEVPKIARETGFSDIGGITAAIGAGYSAGGTIEQVVSATRASAMLTAMTPDAIDEYTAAAIDLSRATGIDDARRNLGLLLSVGPESRVADPIALAESLAPAVNNAVAQVPNQNREEASREAAALFSTLTQVATDTTGDPSRTATIQFSSELGKYFSGRKADPGTLFGRIEALQSDQAMRDEFLSKEFGEASFRTAFKQLTDAKSEAAAMLRDAKSAISTDAKVFAAEVRSERTMTPHLRLGLLSSQSNTNLELLKIGKTEDANLAQVREIVASTLAETPASGFFERQMQAISETGIGLGRLRGSTAVEEAISGMSMLQTRRVGPFRDGLVGDDVAKATAIGGQIGVLRNFVQEEATSGRLPRSLAGRAAAMARDVVEEQRHFAGSPELLRGQPLQAEAYAENARVMARLADVLERVAASSEKTASNTAPQNRPAPPPPNYNAGLQSAADQNARP